MKTEEVNLLQTTDASIWAKEFMRIWGHRLEEIDEGLMLGWFANMWAATHDPLTDEIEQLRSNENATLKTIETIQTIRMAEEAANDRLRDQIEQKSKRIAELEKALQYLQSRFLIHAKYCQAIHRRDDLYGDDSESTKDSTEPECSCDRGWPILCSIHPHGKQLEQDSVQHAHGCTWFANPESKGCSCGALPDKENCRFCDGTIDSHEIACTRPRG